MEIDIINNINAPENEPTQVIPAPSFGPWRRDMPASPPDLVGSEVRPDQHNERAKKELLDGMAERTAKTNELLEKRRQHAPVEVKVELSAIDGAINALADAADDFEGPNGYLGVNQPLLDARGEVERLRRQLAESEARLLDLENLGDSVQRLTSSIRVAESQLLAFISKAETAEVNRLAAEHYGWSIPQSKISSEVKRDISLHASVLAFKTFYVPRSIVSHGQTLSVDLLKAQLQNVGEKLTELRDHLSGE